MRAEIAMILERFADRPMIELKDKYEMLALLDTGARFPVWTGTISDLELLGAKRIKRKVEYSGFGGKVTGDIYRIPILTLTDGVGALNFPQLPIVTNEKLSGDEIPFQMILSATMFKNLIYTIDDKHHRLIIQVPDDESCVRNAAVNTENGLQILIN